MLAIRKKSAPAAEPDVASLRNNLVGEAYIYISEADRCNRTKRNFRKLLTFLREALTLCPLTAANVDGLC